MRHYYSSERIKQVLGQAEAAGVNTLIARTDFHVIRLLMEYWDEGGTLQWFARTCLEVSSHTACFQVRGGEGAREAADRPAQYPGNEILMGLSRACSMAETKLAKW